LHDLVDSKERWIQIEWRYSRKSRWVKPMVWLTSGRRASADATARAGHGLGLATTFSAYELPIPAPASDRASCPPRTTAAR
jgi:hypothetical protein